MPQLILQLDTQGLFSWYGEKKQVGPLEAEAPSCYTVTSAALLAKASHKASSIASLGRNCKVTLQGLVENWAIFEITLPHIEITLPHLALFEK